MISLRAVLLAACALLATAGAPAAANAPKTGLPPVRHVFVIMLENENADTTFGAASAAQYLSQTLRLRGAFIPQYYGVTHESLGNYVAFVSGQGTNVDTQADCVNYSDFVGAGFTADGQALGQGCVYPSTVATVADQLAARGLAWKGYMEGHGERPGARERDLRHPQLNSVDGTQTAEAADQYASRHNPFVYFIRSSIRPPAQRTTCRSAASRTISRGRARLRASASSRRTSVTTGTTRTARTASRAGLTSADAFLKQWVPVITSSPAFKHDGLLLITFDEAEGQGTNADATACCNEAQFPNTPNNGGPTVGSGGGRVGAVALSPFIRAGTTTQYAYNHFSALRTIETLFGLPFLGYTSSPDPGAFGRDVFTS